MRTRPAPKTFLYTALPCEAKPLIEHYRLKKDTKIYPFAVYGNNDTCLIVTGMGKTAMAAGIAYSQALYASSQNPVMLNIGIAGHKNHVIGNVFHIDKITDNDTGRRYYPPLVFTPPCQTANLTTFSRPQPTYPETDLCDMEASAFYETATRFSSGELVQCLKVVSDNETSPAETVQSKLAERLISEKLLIIDKVMAELIRLRTLLAAPDLADYDRLLQHYHFSANEQIQLKKLLTRWRLIKGENKVDFINSPANNGKAFLKRLDELLNQAEFYL